MRYQFIQERVATYYREASSPYQARDTDNPWSRLEGIAEGLIKSFIGGIDSPVRGDFIMKVMKALRAFASWLRGIALGDLRVGGTDDGWCG